MEAQRDDDPGRTAISGNERADADRQTFFAGLGKFSAVTPPMITFLLSTTLASEAIATSGCAGGGKRD